MVYVGLSIAAFDDLWLYCGVSETLTLGAIRYVSKKKMTPTFGMLFRNVLPGRQYQM